MNKVIVRSLSGIVYMAVIIACIFLGVNAVTVLALVFGAIGLAEFYKITEGKSLSKYGTFMSDYVSVVTLILGCYRTEFFLIWPLFLIIRFVEELYIHVENPINSLGRSVFAQLYLGLPLGLMQNIETFNNGGSWNHGFALLAVFIFIWLNDTGAFCVGSLCGRHKLFERISPNKTWEGFMGGLVCNIVAAILFSLFCPAFFALPANIWLWIGLAIIVTVFGTWGDLLESLIKRTYKVKDSGHWIPGHGGILDRIDSLLLVAPVVALYLQLW